MQILGVFVTLFNLHSVKLLLATASMFQISPKQTTFVFFVSIIYICLWGNGLQLIFPARVLSLIISALLSVCPPAGGVTSGLGDLGCSVLHVQSEG